MIEESDRTKIKLNLHCKTLNLLNPTEVFTNMFTLCERILNGVSIKGFTVHLNEF